MAGRPGSTDNNDGDGANGNTRGNADDVRASDWQGSAPPLLDLDALIVVVVYANADEGPPFYVRA